MAHVNYSLSSTGGNVLYNQVVDPLINVWKIASRLKAECDSLVGAGVYANLETSFGLAAGTGQTLYNYVANLKANLDSTCALIADLDKLA